MAVQILSELNQELTRLFVAGSRLAAGDPRLKKYLAPLQQYGEKSPVFLKLGSLVEGLLSADASDSAQKLIEAETFLLSVLSTQGESSPPQDETVVDIGADRRPPAQDAQSAQARQSAQAAQAVKAMQAGKAGQAGNAGQTGKTEVGYRELAPVVGALRVSGSGRMDILKDAFAKGVFSDPRLAREATLALGDKYAELAEYISDTVLPAIGERAYGILLDEYDEKGETLDGRRLAAMHKIKGREMLPLAEEAGMGGSATVKAQAARIMGGYPECRDVLAGMLNDSKPVREEAERAIERIEKESKRGFFGRLFGKKQ